MPCSGAVRRRSSRSAAAWARPRMPSRQRIRRTTTSGWKCTRPASAAQCKLVAEGGISNQRICQHDAVEVLRDMIGPETLSGVHLLPRPRPKARHHKRRLIQPPLVATLVSKLTPGGLHPLRATDWENYAEQMLEVLGRTRPAEHGRWLRPAPGLPPAHQVRAARPAPRARRVGSGFQKTLITAGGS